MAKKGKRHTNDNLKICVGDRIIYENNANKTLIEFLKYLYYDMKIETLPSDFPRGNQKTTIGFGKSITKKPNGNDYSHESLNLGGEDYIVTTYNDSKNKKKFVERVIDKYKLSYKSGKAVCNIFPQKEWESNRIILEDSGIKDKVDTSTPSTSRKLLHQITTPETDWKTLSFYIQDNQIIYEIEECLEWTYFIQDIQKPTLEKIGTTKKTDKQDNPLNRINSQRTGAPSINIDIIFPATLYSEKTSHEKFSSYRDEREWFHKTKDIKSFIETEKSKQVKFLQIWKDKKEYEQKEQLFITDLNK